MINIVKLVSPCSYQGAKQRVAKEIVDYILNTTFLSKDIKFYDLCCGSGSIPLAAKLEGRNYIAMDNGICEKKNSEYFGISWADVATDRIEKYKGV